jgi:hypothetical protein
MLEPRRSSCATDVLSQVQLLSCVRASRVSFATAADLVLLTPSGWGFPCKSLPAKSIRWRLSP